VRCASASATAQWDPTLLHAERLHARRAAAAGENPWPNYQPTKDKLKLTAYPLKYSRPVNDEMTPSPHHRAPYTFIDETPLTFKSHRVPSMLYCAREPDVRLGWEKIQNTPTLRTSARNILKNAHKFKYSGHPPLHHCTQSIPPPEVANPLPRDGQRSGEGAGQGPLAFRKEDGPDGFFFSGYPYLYPSAQTYFEPYNTEVPRIASLAGTKNVEELVEAERQLTGRPATVPLRDVVDKMRQDAEFRQTMKQRWRTMIAKADHPHLHGVFPAHVARRYKLATVAVGEGQREAAGTVGAREKDRGATTMRETPQYSIKGYGKSHPLTHKQIIPPYSNKKHPLYEAKTQ